MIKLREFVGKHPDLCSIVLLTLLCGVFLFWGLDFYPLLDVDETRYAIMSRDLANSNDWNVLLLNSVPFLEKPPFYFWVVGASIKLFGSFSEFAVRFPIALMATFLVFFTYFFGKKVLSRKFGLYSAIVLLTSVFFLILSHVAILDMVLTVWLASALYSAFLSFTVEEKYKKYCWWAFWTFAGLGFLAKGILAIAIPVVVLFVYGLITKTLKEMVKPVNFLVGLVIFLLISLPWHLVMFRDYGWTFVHEYFIKHHFARLLTSAELGRKHGFFYFIPIFIVAFMPWTFIFIASIIDGCKKLIKKYKELEGTVLNRLYGTIQTENVEQNLILFASIFFIVVFGVMSVSSTKLPTYILPALPAAALLTGYYWSISEKHEEYQKSIQISTYIIAMIFIIASLVASVAYVFLPQSILELVSPFKYSVLIGCAFVGMYLLIKMKSQETLSVFSGYVVTMFFVITFAVTNLFALIYAGGENELVLFTKYACTTNTRLVTFDFAVKPSTKIYYKDFVYFITDDNFEELNSLTSNKSTPTYVIVKNKEVKKGNYQDKLNKTLHLVKSGKKYSLYINKNLPEKTKAILWLK